MSIHPCRHADVLKFLGHMLIQSDQFTDSEDALSLFLKFISSVIPSLEMDFN